MIKGTWDLNKIESYFWEIDHEEVKRIPLSAPQGKDVLVWHYDSKGEFTVKSGYHLAMAHEENDSNGIRCGFIRGLKKLWNLQIPKQN